MELSEIILGRTDLREGCWETDLTPSQPYPQVTFKGKTWRVSRLMYTVFYGPIPPGLVIDHLCRNTRCIRPDHLEIVTNDENVRRGNVGLFNSGKTECPRGHAYDADNTIIDRKGHRKCKECAHFFMNRAYARRKARPND